MKDFNELVNDFNDMEKQEKLYWLGRIFGQLKLTELFDVTKELREIIERLSTAPPAAPPAGPSDQIGTREPKDPKTPLLGSGAARRLDEDRDCR